MSRENRSLVAKLREIHDWIDTLGEVVGRGYYRYPAKELDEKLMDLAVLIKKVPELIDRTYISQIQGAINNMVGRHGTLQGQWINSLLRPLSYVRETLEAGGGNPAALTLEARALALLVQHPEWTNAQIADAVPCARTTLNTWSRFMAARKAQKLGEAPPRGFKDRDSGNFDTDHK